MTSTLRGKTGNIGETVPGAEQPGPFLFSHVVLAFCNNGEVVIFLEPSLASLGMAVRVRGRHGAYGVSIW